MKRRIPCFWIVLLVFSVMLAWSAPVFADTAAGLPTLSINNVHGIAKDGEAEIEFTIANIGDGVASFPGNAIRYDIRENNKVVAMSVGTDVYKIGESRQESKKIENLSPGKHTFVVRLDPLNEVQEKDETRHQATVTVDIPGWDLTITSVRVMTVNPDTKSDIKLQVTVKNLGPANWSIFEGYPLLSCSVQGFNNTKQFPAPQSLSLWSGGTHTVSVTLAPFTSKSGSYNIVATIQQPGDPSPANNSFTLPIVIKPAPLEKVDPSDVNKPAGADNPIRGPILDNKPPAGAGPKLPTGR